VAIAFAAATLPTPTQIDSSGDGGSSGGDDRVGVSEDEGEGIFPTADSNVTSGSPGPAFGFCNPVLLRVDVLAALAGAVLLGGGLLTRLYDVGVGTAFVVIGMLLLGITVLLFLVACGSFDLPTPFSDSTSNPSISESESGDDGGGSGDDGSSTPSVSVPSFAAVLLVGLALLGLLVAGLSLRGSDSADDDTPVVSSDAQSEAAIGAAAGRAADDLEAHDETELENAIYRAWAEMTDELSVDRPESSTPVEFARAAVEAGMAPDHVDELTDLFEEVRYGTAPPTDRREQQAIEALRRIERSYSTGDDSIGETPPGDDR
jgi:hypothetical protein